MTAALGQIAGDPGRGRHDAVGLIESGGARSGRRTGMSSGRSRGLE